MYNFKSIEKKWQKYWKDNNVYETNLDTTNNKKYYVLDMFPYPSGVGLHVGHPEGYTATDIVARYKKLKGYEVLHPIGFDSFGLPAEHYAIITGNSPKEFTMKNINHFREQLMGLGFSYDYSKEVITSESWYYKWTQWLFTKFYENDLVEIKEIEVNWCPKLNTVLANEEVYLDENNTLRSERGDFEVVKKPMKQWVMKITQYAKKLYDGLDLIDWPNSIKNLQRNWIYQIDEDNKKHLHLRDWIFARQRYWGEPFPILHHNGETEIISKNDLPVELPIINDYKFSEDGMPALSKAKNWINVNVNGKDYTRDLNTMPQWAGSCWYYLAYILKDFDSKGNPIILDFESDKAKKRLEKWLPVDLYIGGQEHAVLHLMYARFWHKFLSDANIISSKNNAEPFQKLFTQGMILGKDNLKMSKSKGNTVDPDDIIEQFGADSLRIYEMFMGPLNEDKPWSDKGIKASNKWLNRVYNIMTNKEIIKEDVSIETKNKFNELIDDVSNLYEELKFNVAISKMMVFVNHIYKSLELNERIIKDFVKMLSCIAPHISEEIYSQFNNESVYQSKWPEKYIISFKKKKLLPIILNGKVKIELNIDDKFEEKYNQRIVLNLNDNNSNFISDIENLLTNEESTIFIELINISGKAIYVPKRGLYFTK